MSNASKFVAAAVAVRAAGSKHPQTGITYGGVYYPEHVIDGRKVTARFEMNAYINGMNYTDPETGIVKEGRNEVVRIVAWNGQNAKPGGGLADLCAKAVTVGKEFSCELDIRTFKNGNGHVTFTRPDLVERMNLIIAKHYPGALPAPK